MRAKDIMSSPVITVGMNTSVETAADLMLKHEISCLVVVDAQNRPKGIITHSDFGLKRKFMPLADNLYKYLETYTTPETIEKVAATIGDKPVGEVMSKPVITVKEDTMLSEVAEVMLRRRIRRLPVVRGDRLVGLITRHDFLKLIASKRLAPA